MFSPTDDMNDTVLAYLPAMRKTGFPVYYLVAGLVFLSLGSLFFIKVSISVQAPGIIRPILERTMVRCVVPGIIDSIYSKEGQRIEKSACILTIRDQAVGRKKLFNEEEIDLQKNFIHDLLLITGGQPALLPLLITPLYKGQASRFFYQEAEQRLNMKKADREAAISRELIRDKVISRKELFDTQVGQAKMQAAYQSFRLQQFALWQQDLVNCRLKLKELIGEQEEFRERRESHNVRAPVSGVLQGISQRYSGSAVQPDEILCSISPEGELVAECYVATRDAGLLRPGQKVRFQIDAFNANYFGAPAGNIYSVDNDYTLKDNKPVFRVICHFDQQQEDQPRHYRGELKKGLTFRARFISAERTLWQLLYDSVDDWINPLVRQEQT